MLLRASLLQGDEMVVDKVRLLSSLHSGERESGRGRGSLCSRHAHVHSQCLMLRTAVVLVRGPRRCRRLLTPSPSLHAKIIRHSLRTADSWNLIGEEGRQRWPPLKRVMKLGRDPGRCIAILCFLFDGPMSWPQSCL